MSSIRRQVNIAVAPRSVWRALSTPEGWMAWYADGARVDGRAGGRIVLDTQDDEGGPVSEVGTIHTWRPISRIEIAWDSSSPAETRGTRVTFSVARDGDQTRLSLLHSGAALEDPELCQRVDRTWRQALLALREMLEG